MDASEVRDMIDYHKKWLLGEPDGIRLVCDEVKFDDIGFVNVDFREAKFLNCEFNHTNFGGAKLDGAYFSGSQISGVDFTKASLRWSIFHHCHIWGCGFQETDFRWSRLTEVEISNSDFIKSKLKLANFNMSSIENTKFIEANLQGATFCKANIIPSLPSIKDYITEFQFADLTNADFREATMKYIQIYNANLTNANFDNATISLANFLDSELKEANFENTHFVEEVEFNYPIACPKGAFTGWKKAKQYVVKLEVLADARRSSSTGKECRCDKAKVIAIENVDGSESGVTQVSSNYDKSFIYRVGEVVSVDDFDTNRWANCTRGIHFFTTRQNAVDYIY